MEKPTADCKHARQEIEHKMSYSANELANGCWVCNGPLTPSTMRPITLATLNTDDETRQRCEIDPAFLKCLLDGINRPSWLCSPCTAKRFAGYRKRKPEEYISAEQFRANLDDPDRYAREMQNLIADVEACVPDCPYRDRLEIWRGNANPESTP